MHQRTRPPRAACSLLKTSLVARPYFKLVIAGIGRRLSLQSLTSWPTWQAQLKILRARPPLDSAPLTTFE